MQKNELLAHIKRGILRRDPEAEVILFGSRARDDERSDSDWDILVLTKKEVTYELERDLRDPIFELELDTGEVISLMVYSKDDWQRLQEVSPLFLQVKKEGVYIWWQANLFDFDNKKVEPLIEPVRKIIEIAEQYIKA